jgi:cytoskeletal protein CcmA (bactofilin family)
LALVVTVGWAQERSTWLAGDEIEVALFGSGLTRLLPYGPKLGYARAWRAELQPQGCRIMLFKQNAPNGQSGQQGPSGKSATTATESASPAKTLMSAAKPASDSTATRALAATDVTDSGKRLIVGEGIQMKGEITACDRLIVEGQVEVTLKATRMLEIKPTGHFTGSCEVEEAEVSGVYEGNLTVRGRLTVHAGGRVTGDINYGEIELERGAEITGKLGVREQASRATIDRGEARLNAA